MNSNMIGLSGDWHGNWRWAKKVLDEFRNREISTVIQLGDFGLWPGFEGVKFLDRVNMAAIENAITVYAVRGNHDSNYWEHVLDSDFYTECSVTGGKFVRSNIVLLPRTGEFFMGRGTNRRRFYVAGGAASIDRDWRREGRSWWPEELLTEEEVQNVPEFPADILLTHDASTRTPFGFRLFDHRESEISRGYIDEILRKTTPKLHFHGHYHRYYRWENRVGDHVVNTYGLDMDGAYRTSAVVDLDCLEVTEVF